MPSEDLSRLARKYIHLVEKSARSTAQNNPHIDRDELYSYLLEKFPGILEKVDPDRKPLQYISNSLRLHGINFIRDETTVKFSRSYTNIYLKWKREGNQNVHFKELSLAKQARLIDVSESQLRETLQSVRARFTSDIECAKNVTNPDQFEDNQLRALNQLESDEKEFLLGWLSEGQPHNEYALSLIKRVKENHANLNNSTN